MVSIFVTSFKAMVRFRVGGFRFTSSRVMVMVMVGVRA